MLAQNFKTATDLGITDPELDALIKVLGMLERDEIRHAEITDRYAYRRKPVNAPIAFNMGEVFSMTNCGTAACIAGSCDFFFHTKFTSGDVIRNGLPDGLDNLFCPTDIPNGQWDTITADEAATAIRSYLTTGEANWDEALAT